MKHSIAVLITIFCMVVLSYLWIASSIYGKLMFPFVDQKECSIFVYPNESIQKAIDEARDGDVICLPPGIWKERNITINKPLTLRGIGPGETIIKWRQEGEELTDPIVILEPQILIENVSIISGKFDRVVLENLKFEDHKHGAFLGAMIHSKNSSVLINKITISRDEHGTGLLINGFNSVTVRESNIFGADTGIELLSSDDIELIPLLVGEVIVVDSRIMNNGIGIQNKIGNLKVLGSNISNNGVGIINSHRLQIFNSTISANGNGIIIGEDDFIFAPPSNSEMVGNVIINNAEYGVFLLSLVCNYSRHYPGDLFFEKGKVYGKDNVIPGPQEPNGNGEGAVCPEELRFLMGKRGGEYVGDKYMGLE